MEIKGGSIKTIMKKVLTLNIYINEDSNEVNCELKHRCQTKEDALNIIQEFINRKRRGKKSDA